MFIESITINQDIVLESNRESQKKFFKIKKRTYSTNDHHKPIANYNFPFGRQTYEKKKVVEKTFVIHKKGYQLNLKKRITTIVGDNGCGKSHLIHFLKPKFLYEFYFNEEQRNEAFKRWLSNDAVSLKFIRQPSFIIFGNEIHKNALIHDFKKDKINISVQDAAIMWDMGESSNGENVLDFINSLSSVENSLIILDEPETSLSLKSQVNITKIFEKLIKQNNQLIIITHSPILMKLSEEVYDFEKLDFVNTEKYITTQSNF